jgi:hypothetical protein
VVRTRVCGEEPPFFECLEHRLAPYFPSVVTAS